MKSHVPPKTTPDEATQSNYEDISSTHLSLDWHINWKSSKIIGSVTHALISHKDVVKELHLDASYLEIHRVHINDKKLSYKLHDRHPVMGNKLVISLPTTLKKDDTVSLTVEYSTTTSCTALAWLDKAQTTGGDFPYVYSQCEAIHARSLVPCQDTPARKFTYDAKVRSTLPALMSALRVSPPKDTPLEDVVGKETVYEYNQPIPMPSYLLAIASGKLIFKPFEVPTGVKWNAGVWTEPELMDASFWEFKEDTSRYVHQAEQLAGIDYEWTTYDILIQPKSAPFGGMENICGYPQSVSLTFATPTLLAGDRSLTDVIAHEISHSWFGNLITCANWNSFWTNEGFTTYMERLILQFLHGKADRDFSYIIGRKALQESLEEMSSEPRYQKLVIPYHVGEDPDEGFSSVPYDKGANFLYYLEKTVGGLDVFLPFVKSYVREFRGKSIATADFHNHLFNFFADNQNALDALKKVDFDAWYNGSGLSLPVELDYDTSLADVAYSLAEKWNNQRDSEVDHLKEVFSEGDIHSFNSNQKVVFLEKLQSYPTFKKTIPEALATVYGFDKAQNAEIRFRFYMLALTTGSTYVHSAAEWVSRQGRMKFCRPLFRSLNKVDSDTAKKTFLDNQSFYHPIATKQIRRDLKLDEAVPASTCSIV
ncbi:hypothetical protein E3Q06_00076 [Wallemia mellicola]|nr:hypothetical protein E3Q21_00075 [Wallemia mellicola]TIB92800.1 hypothetical protein E3Q20_00076 [Wallemia mellicola]TIC44490.1 hypothetical protein E3Q07_00076 [Wallemia mellicola]TIC53687.1 hypothetical protein E3Q06_00076 [Wallemia mellicola]